MKTAVLRTANIPNRKGMEHKVASLGEQSSIRLFKMKHRKSLDRSNIFNMHGWFGRLWSVSGSRLPQSTRESLSALSICRDTGSSAVNPIATAHARSLKLDRDDDLDVGLEVGASRYQFELKQSLDGSNPSARHFEGNRRKAVTYGSK